LQGRNFANKIWNAFRLIKGWEIADLDIPEENKAAVEWFESKFNASLLELEDHFSKFRISDALMTVYKLMWDDFCSWYLEIIKPEFGKPIDSPTYHKTIEFFESVLKILHPFMPFITEELWSELKERKEKDCLIVASWPESGKVKESIIQEADLAFQVVTEIRNTRNSKGLSPKEPLALQYKKEQSTIQTGWSMIKKMSNLSSIDSGLDATQNGTGFLVGNMEFFIPLAGMVDTEQEKENIHKDIEYQKGFLASVEKKLNNEKFVNSAPPAVVENERKKKADAEAKIKALEEALAKLG
jgi:valyl-tRNA synthetase